MIDDRLEILSDFVHTIVQYLYKIVYLLMCFHLIVSN